MRNSEKANEESTVLHRLSPTYLINVPSTILLLLLDLVKLTSIVCHALYCHAEASLVGHTTVAALEQLLELPASFNVRITRAIPLVHGIGKVGDGSVNICHIQEGIDGGFLVPKDTTVIVLMGALKAAISVAPKHAGDRRSIQGIGTKRVRPRWIVVLWREKLTGSFTVVVKEGVHGVDMAVIIRAAQTAIGRTFLDPTFLTTAIDAAQK
jgi:hypothetical protein